MDVDIDLDTDLDAGIDLNRQRGGSRRLPCAPRSTCAPPAVVCMRVCIWGGRGVITHAYTSLSSPRPRPPPPPPPPRARSGWTHMCSHIHRYMDMHKQETHTPHTQTHTHSTCALRTPCVRGRPCEPAWAAGGPWSPCPACSHTARQSARAPGGPGGGGGARPAVRTCPHTRRSARGSDAARAHAGTWACVAPRCGVARHGRGGTGLAGGGTAMPVSA